MNKCVNTARWCVVGLMATCSLLAQVQPNSATATLLVDGGAARGFANALPRLMAPGASIGITIAGPAGAPFIVVGGTAMEPGLPVGAQFVNVDLATAFVAGNGLVDPTWTVPPSGLFSTSGAPPLMPFGTETTMQVLMIAATGNVMTAPARFMWVPGDPVPATFLGSTIGLGHSAGNRNVAVGHINGDGHVDLADSSAIWLGDGAGGFSYAGIDPGGVEAALVDLVGDGNSDLVVLDEVFLGLKIFPGDGSGNFLGQTPVQLPVFCNDAGQFVATDFNGDGMTDILIATGDTASAGTIMFQSIGGGQFFQVGSTLYEDSHAAASGDFNNDGVVDLVVSGIDFAGVEETRVLFGPAPHGLANSVVVGTAEAGSRWLQAADMNGDANLDLVWVGPTQQGVLLGDGSGGFSSSPAPTAPAPGFWLPRLDAVDIDDDGDLDLVSVDLSHTPAFLVVAANDGAGGFGAGWYVPLHAPSASNAAFAVGADVDGDGDTDVIAGGTPGTVFLNDH